ncbi:hypothetical protein, partial [Mycobacterium tuberculosis]
GLLFGAAGVGGAGGFTNGSA